jgi:hypothetical protein
MSRRLLKPQCLQPDRPGIDTMDDVYVELAHG